MDIISVIFPEYFCFYFEDLVLDSSPWNLVTSPHAFGGFLVLGNGY